MISNKDKKNKGEKMKRNTNLIIISVIVLTILTLNVSYSAFFDVQLQPTVQSFTTGTLNVTIDSSEALSGVLTPTNNLPTASTSTKPDKSYALLTLKNTGTLNANFEVKIENDTLPSGAVESDRLAPENILVGVYDESANAWIEFDGKYNTTLSSLKNNVILSSTIDGNNVSKTYRISVWLPQNLDPKNVGKLIYLKLSVRSTVA